MDSRMGSRGRLADASCLYLLPLRLCYDQSWHRRFDMIHFERVAKRTGAMMSSFAYGDISTIGFHLVVDGWLYSHGAFIRVIAVIISRLYDKSRDRYAKSVTEAQQVDDRHRSLALCVEGEAVVIINVSRKG